MLGKELGSASGKRTGRRVLSVDGGFKVEVSFESKGTLLGTPFFEIGTYTSGNRPDGSIYGEGQGVVISQDGDVITWKGAGAGVLTAGGGARYRGAVYYSTSAPKFASLNKIAAVFEFEGDAEGNTSTKLWEWS